MENLLLFLQSVFAPLSYALILAAIVAGISFGAIHYYRYKLSEWVIYHTLLGGINFIAFVFIFRLLDGILAGAAVTNPAGWIGIGLLWALFCFCIWVGYLIRQRTG